MLKIAQLGLALSSLLLAAGCVAGPMPPIAAAAAAGGRPVEPAVVTAEAGGQDSVAAGGPAALPAVPALSPAVASLSAPAVMAATPMPAAQPGGLLSPGRLPPSPMTAATLTEAASAGRVPILEYHYSSFEMLPTVMMRPAWFQAQMQWLAQAGYHSLSSPELAGFVSGTRPIPARSVALTFDVGASHFGEYIGDIVPTLRRNHLRGIFFVLSNQTKDTCDGQIACWPDLLAWRDEGLISIESHSYMHEDYASLSPERLRFDITRSKADIEAHTGQPVLGLCYPFDSVTPAAVALLAKAGYQFAVAGATRHDRSAEWSDPQPFVLPRYYPYSGETSYPLIGGTGGLTFEQMMQAASAN